MGANRRKTSAAGPPKRNKRRTSKPLSKLPNRVRVKAAAQAPRKTMQRLTRGAARAKEAWLGLPWPTLVRAGSLGMVALLSVAGAVGFVRFVRTTSLFSVQHVVVTGNQHLDSRTLQRVTGLVKGLNIFEVAPAKAQDDLRKNPWVKDATVRRRLPGSIEIELQEHEPAAVLMADAGLFLVSTEGLVFHQVSVDDPLDLPFISGVQDGRFAEDPLYRQRVLRESVALLQDYRELGLAASEPISELHLGRDGSVELYIGRDAMHVRLGHAPHRSKLHRLQVSLHELGQRGLRPEHIYLDNVRRPERVSVLLQTAAN